MQVLNARAVTTAQSVACVDAATINVVGEMNSDPPLEKRGS